MGVIMYNDIENYIRFYSQLIVNLIVDFCFSHFLSGAGQNWIYYFCI